MKIGIPEIIIIGLVMIVIPYVMRSRPATSRHHTKEEEEKQGQLTAVEARDAAILRSRRSGGKIFGIVLIVAGVLLIVTAPSLIKAFFASYIGGTVIIVIGLALLYFLSRRS